MNIRIQHIDLSLHLDGQNKRANLENEIRQQFIHQVLKPLDKKFSTYREQFREDIMIPDISIDQAVPSLALLDNYFEKVRKKIEQQIQFGIDNIQVNPETELERKLSFTPEEGLLSYLINGTTPARMQRKDWKHTIHKSRIEQLLYQIKKLDVTWNIHSTTRLVELFSFNELAMMLYNNTADKKKVRLELQQFWFNHYTEEESFISSNETLSFTEYLNYIFAIINKENAVPQNNFQLATIHLLMKAAGIKVQNIHSTNNKKGGQKENLQAAISSQTILKPLKIKQDHHRSKGISSGKIYLENAGLFLLHPFLPQFFEQQKIWLNGELTNYNLAASLLYYLASGDTMPKNYQLNTVKILLGLQSTDALYCTAPLMDDHKEKCDELLRAVITHWGSLGNISPDGLRQMFLQRQGVANFNNGNWNIAISHQAQDVLIDRMPWAIRIIKLPWIKGLLNVQIK